MKSTQKIKVPSGVLEGIEAVRRSGKANMLDWNEVQVQAMMMDYLDTAAWLEVHHKIYRQGYLRGFEEES